MPRRLMKKYIIFLNQIFTFLFTFILTSLVVIEWTQIMGTNLGLQDCGKTKSEKLHRARMPSMLLFLVSFIRLGQFTKDFNIIEIDELPSMQMCSNRNVHIFNCGSFEPPTRFFQCLDSPNASSPIETKETQKMAVDLLFNLKMEAQIDVLQPC